MIRVLILSDICLYMEGLVRILAHEPALAVTGTASSGAAARAALDARPADVVLVDLALPDALSCARALKEGYPEVRLVALGIREDRRSVLECAEAGITGFVYREGSVSDLLAAIVGAASSELSCSPRIAGALIERIAGLGIERGAPRRSGLTPRESQIVRMLDDGLTNKEIALRLHISAATTRNHVHSILEKLGAHTRGEAAATARRAADPELHAAQAIPME